MINLNLINLDKPIQDLYEEADKHSDCSFFKLPPEAQEEAKRIISEFHTYNEVRRELDRSLVFRRAFEEILKHKGIDVYDPDFNLQAVDTVIRYRSFLLSGAVA